MEVVADGSDGDLEGGIEAVVSEFLHNCRLTYYNLCDLGSRAASFQVARKGSRRPLPVDARLQHVGTKLGASHGRDAGFARRIFTVPDKSTAYDSYPSSISKLDSEPGFVDCDFQECRVTTEQLRGADGSHRGEQ